MKKYNKILASLMAIITTFSFMPANTVKATEGENIQIISPEETSDIADNTEDPQIVSVEAISDVAGSTEDNWQISLCYYDSFHGTEQLIDSSWNPEKFDETNVMTFHLNYRNDNTKREYAPGELVITLDKGIIENERIFRNVAADKAGDSSKTHDFSYEETDTSFIFTNNHLIEVAEAVSGSIEITYSISAVYYETDTSFDVSADINGTKSNNVTWNFTSNTASYRIDSNAEKLKWSPKFSEDYIYVKYTYTPVSTDEEVRRVTHDSAYLSFDLPANCLIYDMNMNPIDASKIPYTEWDTYWGGFKITRNGIRTMSFKFICAYPKDEYLDKTTNAHVEFYGNYSTIGWQEKTPDNQPAEFICEAEKNVTVGDFLFDYEGYIVGIGKNAYNYNVDYYDASGTGAQLVYTFSPLIHSAAGYGMIFGDDLLLAQNKSGNIVKLEDNEYHFTYICVENIKDENGELYQDGEFDYDIYIRTVGNTDYTLFKTVSYKKGTIMHDLPENVVGFYIKSDNIPRGLVGGYNGFQISTSIIVSKQDIAEDSSIWNFCYIKLLDEEGNYLNEPTLDNYKGMSNGDLVAGFDKDTYGTYMQRDFAETKLHKQSTRLVINTDMNRIMSQDNAKTRFTVLRTDDLGFDHVSHDKKIPDIVTKWQYAAVLPEGMEIIDTPLFEEYYWGPAEHKLVKAGDTTFSSSGEFTEYLKSHLKYEILENFDGSGKTKLECTIDFSDAPLDITKWKQERINEADKFIHWQPNYLLQIKVPLGVSYDSYLECGDTYRVVSYADLEGDETTHVDHDYDENLNGYGAYTASTSSIASAISTQQGIQKLVQTDKNNFTIGEDNGKLPVEATAGSIYTYKLRVRTGESDITDLVIYDNLEEAYGENKYWKGSFAGVDTEYAQSQGYNVKVWYSEKFDATTLDDGSWKEYNSTISNEKVKSIAFEYFDTSGNKAVIPANKITYVLVKMQSPDMKTRNYAYNNFHTTWNEVDDLGQVDDRQIKLTSNTSKVKITKEGINTVSLVINKIFNTDKDQLDFLQMIETHVFTIELRSVETGDVIKVLVNGNGSSVVENIEPGTYEVTEENSAWYKLVTMSTSDAVITNENGNYLLELDGALEQYNMQIENKTTDVRYYDYADSVLNFFKGK